MFMAFARRLCCNMMTASTRSLRGAVHRAGVNVEHAVSVIRGGPLVAVLVPHSSSQLLAPTRGLLHVFSLTGTKGLFSKEHDDTRVFGAGLCGEVREAFDCQGFFTTDELPRYGLSAEDSKLFFALYRDADEATDTLVLMNYHRRLAEKVRGYLIERLRRSVLPARQGGR